MFLRSDEFSPFLYRGGFMVLSIATALVVAALVHPASRLGPIVGWRPLRWIGERSYGIYLWHFPIIILTSPEGTQRPALGRAVLQVAATIGVSALSWRYLEDPIRHGALKRVWAAFRSGEWYRHKLPRAAWPGAAVGAVVLFAALAGLAGAGVRKDDGKEPGDVHVSQTLTTTYVPPDSKHAMCKSVVHIGDSTSEGLVSANYLPNPKKRIAAQYGRIGIRTQHLEVSGARSIYERFQGQPNANDVAAAWKHKHFDGCWVLALGTNEGADVAAGSKVGLDKRIDIMMATIGDQQPVMWVNTKSLRLDGPYASSSMQAWDAALIRACARYPNMRVYDWASDVRDDWFIPDGIHFTTPGYAARGRLIAQALLKAFPAGGRIARPTGTSCIVHPDDTEPPAASGGQGPSTSGRPSPPTTADEQAGGPQ
jgi:hypothetical protein